MNTNVIATWVLIIFSFDITVFVIYTRVVIIVIINTNIIATWAIKNVIISGAFFVAIVTI